MVSHFKWEIIHVMLTDEPVPVWRPVKALRTGQAYYQIIDQEVPEFEQWEFEPGSKVRVELIDAEDGKYLRAVERV